MIKSTRRSGSESTHCPAVLDHWDCVLNDLEELGGNEFLVLTDQYSIEIFSCCLHLLPSCFSYITRPTLRVLKFVPKIIFQSPEFDRAIFFPKKFSVSKKSVQSFCRWVRLIRLSPWFNINPFPFKNMYSP